MSQFFSVLLPFSVFFDPSQVFRLRWWWGRARDQDGAGGTRKEKLRAPSAATIERFLDRSGVRAELLRKPRRRENPMMPEERRDLQACPLRVCGDRIRSGIAFLQVFFTAKAFGNRDAFHLIFLDFCDLICEDYYDIFVRTSWSFWEMITTNKIYRSRKIKKILECQKCTDDIWIDAIWTFTRAFLALSDIRPRTLAISRRTADFCSRDLFAWNKARALAPPFTSREKIEDSSGSIDTLM